MLLVGGMVFIWMFKCTVYGHVLAAEPDPYCDKSMSVANWQRSAALNNMSVIYRYLSPVVLLVLSHSPRLAETDIWPVKDIVPRLFLVESTAGL